MKLVNHFDNFLKETVNLRQSRLDLLDSRVNSIYAALKADADLNDRIVKKIPQGSWAQKTIIDPVNGNAFDADFMLQLKEESDWADDVKQYSNAVYDAIHKNSTYKDMPHGRKCRCVYIEYANSAMHVDVVPYVVLSDGRKVIVNRDDNKWEDTDPEGFTDWMKTKDGITGGNLRKVIRLVKYLRDHKNSFTGTRSILITTLLGEQVAEWRKAFDTGYYADVPTALVHIVKDLDGWLQARPFKPSIADPSGSGTTFDHRWTQATYSYFRQRIHAHAAEIEDAYNETDKDESVKKWQTLFGDKFTAPTTSTNSMFSPITTTTIAGTSSSTGRSGRAG